MSSHPRHPPPPPHRLLLEVPVFSPASAARALAAGAHRLELNRGGSYPAGGLTPSIPDLEVVSRGCGVPLRIMIRPRGLVVAAVAAVAAPGDGDGATSSRATQNAGLQDNGVGSRDAQTPDFVYTDAEFEEMKQCVEVMIATPGLLRPERGDGFVFGVLKEEKGWEEKEKVALVVDVERNSELVRLAGGLPCVFHRAFDDILGSNGSTPEAALADLATCGFHGLLTSGGPGAAAEHPDVLKRIIRAVAAAAAAAAAADSSCGGSSLREIIVGGGVRSSSIARLREVLGGEGLVATGSGVEVWFHSSCLTGQGSSGKRSGQDGEEDEDVVDENELRALAKALT